MNTSNTPSFQDKQAYCHALLKSIFKHITLDEIDTVVNRLELIVHGSDDMDLFNSCVNLRRNHGLPKFDKVFLYKAKLIKNGEYEELLKEQSIEPIASRYKPLEDKRSGSTNHILYFDSKAPLRDIYEFAESRHLAAMDLLDAMSEFDNSYKTALPAVSIAANMLLNDAKTLLDDVYEHTLQSHK